MPARIARVLNDVLQRADHPGADSIRVGTPAWWHWLDAETTRSFSFRGATGTFTARKAQRRRGGTYWTAYRKAGGRVFSAYLGKSTALSAERLAVAATQLAERIAAASATRAPAERATDELSSSSDVLLDTKLYMPPPRAGLVPRTHLLPQLDAVRERGITLLAAPAGFGKSTLLSLWLARQDRPAAWLTLDTADNDLSVWLRYLTAALQTVAPSVGAGLEPVLHAARPPDAFILTTLLNDLVSLDRPVTLVLDDYHAITDRAVHDALAMVLDHRPPLLYVVIASREDPPLPIARWRAAGALTELRAADLRFTSAEIAAFFSHALGVSLAPADVDALERRTEGWAAGLQLVALAMESNPAHDAFIAALNNTHRFIVDYLTDEVLRQTPEHLQRFLLETSILDRLCAPLCDAVVLGEAAPAQTAYSQVVLDELERKNLFLLPLDGQRHWYRYHQLFRDVLHQRLAAGVRPDTLAQLHRRASTWYARHDAPSEALAHAVAAEDWPCAADLIERYGLQLAGRGHIQRVLGWLDSVPESAQRERPLLAAIHAWLLLVTSQPAAAAQRLQQADDVLRTGVAPASAARTRGYIALVRAIMLRAAGDLDGYLALVRQACTLLPETDEFSRGAAVLAAALAYRQSGDVRPATEQQLTHAADRMRALGNLSSAAIGLSELANVRLLQGRLGAAIDTYQRVVQLVPEAVLERLFGGAGYFVGLGAALYAHNDLDAAEPLLERGIALIQGELLVYPAEPIQGYITLAWLRHAHGDGAAAQQLLAELLRWAERRSLVPRQMARIAAAQAELALAQGDLESALRWARDADSTGADAGLYMREAELLTFARVVIAKGRQDPTGPHVREALALLTRLHTAAEQHNRRDSLLTITILRALALAIPEPGPAAVEMIERALTIAAAEGYVRRFLDQGTPISALLRAAQPGTAVPAFVARLLAGGSGAPTCAGRAASPVLQDHEPPGLVEPLTAREIEVLHLLAAGHGTSAIAQQLIVSEGTVKRHISNLLGKLDVHSRLEAVAYARSLGLVA